MLAGCGSLRQTEPDSSRSQADAPPVEIDVEVEEAPKLLQVTK
jgi:hypothetical protein